MSTQPHQVIEQGIQYRISLVNSGCTYRSADEAIL